MRATEKRKTTPSRHRARVAAAEPKPKAKVKPKLSHEQEKAYREYEHAVGLVHKQEYERARAEFRTLAERYPQDRELLDRVRIYLKVCEGRTQKSPRGDTSDVYVQALLRYNEGEYEETLKMLDKVARQSPPDPRVVYLSACARLAHGEREEGMRLLHEAVALDPANRYRALNDPDLEEIRTAEDFLDAIGDLGPAN